MDADPLLLNPGPVRVSDAALAAMDDQIISHRSPAFEAVYERARDGLEYAFTRSTLDESRTAVDGASLVLNGTATMAMEAAVANLAPGGRVVSLVNGKFGERFARIAERHADVTRVESAWGDPYDVEALADAVGDDVDVVTAVHAETSTGLRNALEPVGSVARDHDALLVVDAVTSVGGEVFRVDDWCVDVAVTGAQKALAAPPGLSGMFLTPRATSRVDGDAAPFYLDLAWYLERGEHCQTPFTSAIPLFRALAVAVEDVEREGMPARIARHRRRAAAVRAGVTAMGLDLFGSETARTTRSNTVTTVCLPEAVRGARAGEFFDAMAARNVSVAGGQGHLAGDLFRVSSMGALTAEQIRRGVRTVGEALTDVGVEVDADAGAEAVGAELRG